MTNDQMPLAWIEFLSRFEWGHVVTLTSRFPYGPAEFKAEFEHRFIRRLAQMAQQRIGWFCVREPSASGLLHLHALLVGTQDLSTRHIERSWTAGFTRVTVVPNSAAGVESRRAMIRYVTKRFALTPDNFDLSREWRARGRYCGLVK